MTKGAIRRSSCFDSNLWSLPLMWAHIGSSRGGESKMVAEPGPAQPESGQPGSAQPGNAGSTGGGATGGGSTGGGSTSGGSSSGGTVSESVDRTRSITGLLAVVGGDVAIAIAAILGILHFPPSGGQSSQFVAILSSAFTAIATMTTAYFGIKSISNTAQALGNQTPTSGGQGGS